MSETNPNNGGPVFGAAVRASDYIEEDTVMPSPDRRAHTATPDSAELPSMPSSEAEPTAAAVTPLIAVPPVPESPPETETLAPVVRDRAESLSVLFGGGTPGLTPATAPPKKATQGLRGTFARIGLPIAPGAAELADHQDRMRCLANETTVRQATWTRAVWLLINNKKGGSGKTPVSILLGGLIAAIRGGSVAIFEASDDSGALNFRAEGNPKIGMGELVRDVDRVTTAGQLAGYTAPQTSFASVIGTVDPARPALTGQDVVKVSSKIGEFYSIGVMDSGNVPTSSAFQGAVSIADVLVMPVMNSGDSVYEAIEVLDVLRAGDAHSRALADNAIAIRLKDGRPETEAVAQEVARLLSEAGVRELHEIPYDEHIADRVQLTLDNLNPETRKAFVAAAAGIIRSLQSTVSAGH